MFRIRTFPLPGKSLVGSGLWLVVVLPCLWLVQAQAPSSSMGRQTGADNEYQTGAILWTQSSAEYRALAYQAFSLARLRLDADLLSHANVAQRSSRETRRSLPR